MMGGEATADRIAMKQHRHVMLVQVDDAMLAEELLARRSFARLVAGRLDERVLLVRAGEQDEALEELRKAGHPPRVMKARRTG
jgi:hypothetical protein